MDDYGANRDAWRPDNETAIRYACIRITPGVHGAPVDGFIANPGLYVHTDLGHISVGVTGVAIVAATGFIRISTDGAVNGVPLVIGDETVASKRLMFGATGGNGYIDIRASTHEVASVNLATQAGYDLVASSMLNLWIGWLSPLVRGVGDPSKADRALALIAALEARVAALEGA